jgi:hypothetical protein
VHRRGQFPIEPDMQIARIPLSDKPALRQDDRTTRHPARGRKQEIDSICIFPGCELYIVGRIHDWSHEARQPACFLG